MLSNVLAFRHYKEDGPKKKNTIEDFPECGAPNKENTALTALAESKTKTKETEPARKKQVTTGSSEGRNMLSTKEKQNLKPSAGKIWTRSSARIKK